MTDFSMVPFREVDFAPIDLDVQFDDEGVIRISPNTRLRISEPHIPAYLRRHARVRPDKIWLSRRKAGGGDWQGVSFEQTLSGVNHLTQGLLNLALPEGGRLAILSGNSIEHAFLSLAAMQAQIVFAPISPAYSLQSSDFIKLKQVLETVDPVVLFVQDGKQFAKAIDAVGNEATVIAVDNVQDGQIAYADLLSTSITPAVEQSVESIDPSKTTKLMFTSGSTGSPKAVPQTQRALLVAVCANLQTHGELDKEGTLCRLDWTPWNHVFGATGLLLALVNGGSSFIDDGRPVPHLFGETVRNLREVKVTTFVTVPAAYNMLVEELEADDELAASFFENLHVLGYGGAALPAAIVHRLQALAVKHADCKIPITCGYGATETGPGGAFIYWPTDITGLIGLPHPGYEMKLVPFDEDRYEVRIRSEGVMSGYFGREDLNAEIFDADGFYKIGDTVRLADPDNVLEGLVFAGRISEEFKLQSGTFVLAGSLRLEILKAAAPLIQEVVICGESQLYIGVLVWLNQEAAGKLSGKPQAALSELNSDPLVRDAIRKRLIAHNEVTPGQARRVKRAILLERPPSVDLGEVTDKGSINQRAVQKHRSELVAELFADQPSERVIDTD